MTRFFNLTAGLFSKPRRRRRPAPIPAQFEQLEPRKLLTTFTNGATYLFQGEQNTVEFVPDDGVNRFFRSDSVDPTLSSPPSSDAEELGVDARTVDLDHRREGVQLSLRTMVLIANQRPGEQHTIQLPNRPQGGSDYQPWRLSSRSSDDAGFNGDVNGDLDVRVDISFQGDVWRWNYPIPYEPDHFQLIRPTISAQNGDRLFHVHPGGRLRIDGIILEGGGRPGGVDSGPIARGTARVDHGGAIFVDRVSPADEQSLPDVLTINNSVIRRNHAKSGGAIRVLARSVDGQRDAAVGIMIRDTTFQDNSSDSGGAIYNKSGRLSVHNSQFYANQAHDYGGAVFHEGATIAFENSRFAANSARDGGAIFNSLGHVQLHQSKLWRNTATGAGGAIYNSGPAWAPSSVPEITITGASEIFWNHADGDGGAIYSKKGKVQLSGEIDLSCNSAGGHGGAVFSERGELSLSGSTEVRLISFGRLRFFRRIYQPITIGHNVSVGNGGAIYATGSLSVSDARLSGNSAGSTVDRWNQPVAGAPGVGDGGAIYSKSGSRLTISRATFESNSATNGGAIFLADKGGARLTRVTIRQNEATGYGGGIYWAGGGLRLDYSLVYSNTASESGSDIYSATGESPTGRRFRAPVTFRFFQPPSASLKLMAGRFLPR